jgi:hypothetical protein
VKSSWWALPTLILLALFMLIYMKYFFAITIISVLLIQLRSMSIVHAEQPKVRSFAQWCQQRKSIPVETRHTIDILLEKSGTKNCQQADSILRSMTEINLMRNKICSSTTQYQTNPNSRLSRSIDFNPI